jgi:hypothetical protein
MAARIAMMAMTTSSSISVKPERRERDDRVAAVPMHDMMLYLERVG